MDKKRLSASHPTLDVCCVWLTLVGFEPACVWRRSLLLMQAKQICGLTFWKIVSELYDILWNWTRVVGKFVVGLFGPNFYFQRLNRWLGLGLIHVVWKCREPCDLVTDGWCWWKLHQTVCEVCCFGSIPSGEHITCTQRCWLKTSSKCIGNCVIFVTDNCCWWKLDQTLCGVCWFGSRTAWGTFHEYMAMLL